MRFDRPEIVAESLKDHFDRYNKAVFGLDLDGTVLCPQKPGDVETIELAPDAHILPGTPSAIKILRSAGIPVFAITGRPIDFARRYLGLNGSGQFHGEMTTNDDDCIRTIIPPPDFSAIIPSLQSLAQKHEPEKAFVERKTHYIGVMSVPVTEALKADVLEIISSSPLAGDPDVTVIFRNTEFEIGHRPIPKVDALRDVLGGMGLNKKFGVFAGDTPHMDGPVMAMLMRNNGLGIAVGEKAFGFDPSFRLRDPLAFQHTLGILANKRCPL